MLVKNTMNKEAKKFTNIKPVTDEAHQQVIDLIKGRCLEVSFTIHGLPKKRVIRGKMAQTIAGSIKANTKGISSNWFTFTSDHPAVAEFNQATRELLKLRDTWTIVRSAEAKKGEGGTVNIEGGVRLIWDHDVDEFYKRFCAKAAAIDAAVEKIQKYMDEVMIITDPDTGEKTTYPSIKEMDRANAGDAWNEDVYPKDVRRIAGVARERTPDGNEVLDEQGEPKYLITFEEYHVSEKLPALLRERAVERLDAKMAETVEIAFSYAVAELNEDLTTFMSELVNRVRIYPVKGHSFEKFCEIEAAEVIKVVDHTKDDSIPSGYIKLMLGYKTVPEGGDEKKPVICRQWVGPISVDDYQTEVRPQKTGERKKIYSGVVEGIIAKLEAFKEKKAKMLGIYGENAMAAFEELFRELTKFKAFYTTNDQAAQKLVSKLKNSEEAKEEISELIADTIAALEDQVETVKIVNRRRKIISPKLIGKVGE